MTSLCFVRRLVLVVASGCTLVPSSVFAAPPPVIAVLAGEWSGESSRTPAGEPVARSFSDARRYWIEGDVVRGEILVGAGNSLQTVHVAITPRPGYFLKSVTAENGRTELLVGVTAESGVLWTPLSADKNRFVERVAGDGDQRRLELLVPEGDPATPAWRVSEALQPAAGAMSGVVGGGVADPDGVAPLQLPPDSELALIDRVAGLLQQRDTMRGEATNLARELAAAWRESESASARAKDLEAELVEIKSTLPAATAAAQSGGDGARLEAAEKDALAARRWADELETSLRSAIARAEDATARAEALNTELAAARETVERITAECATLSAELEERNRENEDRGTRVAELEATVRLLEQKSAVAGPAAAEAAQSQQTVARVAEVERALIAVQTELAAVSAAHEQAAGDAAALTAAKAQLEAQVVSLQAELAAANTRRVESEEHLAVAQSRLAAVEQQQREAVTAASNARVAELEQALQAATSLVTARETELATAVIDGEAARARIVALEQELAAAASTSDAANAAAVRLAAIEQDLHAADEARSLAGQQLAAAASERDAAREQLAAATTERDAARAQVTTLEARIEAWARNAPPAAEDSSQQVAALEREVEALRGQLASATTEGGAMASRLQMASDAQARAETELAEARQTLADEHKRAATFEAQLADVRLSAASDPAAAARIAGLESELAVARAEVALAQTRHAEVELDLESARALGESAVQSSEKSTAALNAAHTRVAELEQELDIARNRVASLERELPRATSERTVDTRIADLESRLAESTARSQQRQDEIDRLTARVRELESGAPAPVVAPGFAISSAPAARPSASATPDRPTAAAPTPPPATAPARPAPRSEVANAPPSAPAPDATVGFRLSPTPAAVRPGSAPRLPPTRPTDGGVYVVPTGTVGSDAALAGVVRRLPVNGYRRAPNSLVIINGRPFKPGEVVDAGQGLRFSRVDPDAIIFTGPTGAEYRFEL